MSSPDPKSVEEVPKEVDCHEVGSAGSSRLGESSSNKARLELFKSIERRLHSVEGLKWYEVEGSHLDHRIVDQIKESSGTAAGFS